MFLKQDESIRIAVPLEEIEAPPTEAAAVEDATQEVVREGSAVKKTQQVVALTPPKALFQPIEYPSLHIFVSQWIYHLSNIFVFKSVIEISVPPCICKSVNRISISPCIFKPI